MENDAALPSSPKSVLSRAQVSSGKAEVSEVAQGASSLPFKAAGAST